MKLGNIGDDYFVLVPEFSPNDRPRDYQQLGVLHEKFRRGIYSAKYMASDAKRT
jgi:hypothetical protein